MKKEVGVYSCVIMKMCDTFNKGLRNDLALINEKSVEMYLHELVSEDVLL